MKHLIVLAVVVIGLVSADTYGQYVPKSFFKIDENGNPSPIRPIMANTLNRVRRQIQPIQPFGFPQPIFNFPQIQPGQGGQGSFVSSSQTLSSRFGDDEPVVSGTSTIITNKDGKYQQTSTHLRPDGSTYVNKQSGRVKRQQTQTQSQGSPNGAQHQTQSQNQPGGGQQIQTQSQGADNQHPTPTAGANQHHAAPSQQVHQPEVHQPEVQQPQQQVPQNNQQSYDPQTENRNQNSYPQGGQGQQDYQQGGQGAYPQQPNVGFPFASPFGIGAFGPGGFGQPVFGMPGFGQAGFGQPGFPGAFGFPQQGFGVQQPGFGAFPAGGGVQPGQGQHTVMTGSSNILNNRFGEEETVVTGGTQTITSQNGNFHVSTSVLKPDGQVITTQQSGSLSPNKKN